jgi:hypothetical protein
MTDEKLINMLKTIDIEKGVVLVEDKAVYVVKYCEENGWDDEFIVLLDNGARVGGIYIMGNFDLHFYIFETHRNKHYLSDFMRTRILKQIKPNLTSISCGHNRDSKRFKKVKHLAKLGGYEIGKGLGF